MFPHKIHSQDHNKTSLCRCEVQYDYGLRQRRWIELEKRPASFLTADNKVIQVNQKIAADNDRTLKSGSVILVVEWNLFFVCS